MTAATTTEPVARVLAALRAAGHEPRRAGGGWACRCPSHDDRAPSLSIGTGDDGRALLHCHAGCATGAIAGALGLTLADLMPDDDRAAPTRRNGPARPAPAHPVSARNGHAGAPGAGARSDTQTWPTAAEAVRALELRLGQRSATWAYYDAAGEPVGVVVRWDGADGQKTIRPVSRRGDGWAHRAMPEPRPLYHLPVLRLNPDGEPVYVAEGEKAADALDACGLLATTSAHGSQSAAQTDWQPLAGRDVVVLPDHDDAGERYADDVVDLAYRAGAASVRVVRLADHWPDLPAGGDAADLLDAEGGDTEAVRAGIEALVREAEPEAQPGHPETPRAAQPAQTGLERAPEPYTPMPTDCLPEPLRSYVTEGAAALGCEASYIGLPMLAAVAAAIGNNRSLTLKADWIEPSVIWAAIVGESGSAKSPAIDLATAPLRERQDKAMRDFEREHENWRREHAEWKRSGGEPDAEPKEPIPDRIIVDDITSEALVSRLRENPRGLLLVRDELSAWLDFDRYTGGKGGGERARWLHVYGARPLTIDRKTAKTEYVSRAAVSIAGGIQPGVLQRALGTDDREAGLAARLLFTMPPQSPRKWSETSIPDAVRATVDGVFDNLFSLEPEVDDDGAARPRLVRLGEDEAKDAYVAWHDAHAERMDGLTGDLAAAEAKMPAQAARLSLAVHLCRWAAGEGVDPDALDRASVESGTRLADWFAREARRVCARLDESEGQREDRQLIELIERKGGDVSARELVQASRRFRRVADAEADLHRLAAAGLGEWYTPPPGPRGGQASRRLCLRASTPSTSTEPPL